MVGLERVERAAIRVVAVAEHAREARAGTLVGRDRVRLLLVVDLKAVLDRAQEPICVVEASRVGALDVSRRRQRVQRFERRRASHRVVVPAVHELEELHRELDVADATPTALELAVGEPFAIGDLLGAPLHHPDLAHRARAEHVGPHEWPSQLHEAITEIGVACDGPRLDQRLELPRLCPALVVRGEAVDGSRERAAPAFGAEVGVGAEDDPVFGGGGHRGEHRRARRARHSRRRRRARRARRRPHA